MGTMERYEQQFVVNFSYPVVFTRDVFGSENPALIEAICRGEKSRPRALVVVDSGVVRAKPRLPKDILKFAAAWSRTVELVGPPMLVPGGEAAKNDIRLIFDLVKRADSARLDRHSLMIIVGGGSVLDLAGFAAALLHRGIRTVRIPTTVLSMADSGVGVKNGVNLHGKKNLIGTFAPPFAVINDLAFLDTLPNRDLIAGLSEAVKVALICDLPFFEYMEANAGRLVARNVEPLYTVIRRSAELHLQHIRNGGDPFECGSARPLDFGHWCAHKLESLTGYRLRHGEAVAIGIALDTLYSVRAGHLKPEAADRVLSLLQRLSLNLWDDHLVAQQSGRYLVLQGIQEFREHLGGVLHITLLRELGQRFEVNEIDEALMLESIWELRERARMEQTREPGPYEAPVEVASSSA
jgi:3-dehydroquinate synthase